MKKITQNLKWLVTLLTMIVSMGAWAEETGTITFGNNGTKINGASVTGLDTQENTWTITTVGTTSYTSNADYYQVGSSSKPATSITFTTTLAEDVTITAFSAKFGGFNGTAGTVSLKVGDVTVGTGNLNGTNDVTVSSSSAGTGNVLTVTVTGISKGVKCYNITYTYGSGSQQIVSAPTFSPDGGTYPKAQSVTLSCATEGATIYYTTNGDNPTTNSTQYTEPISITETTTLKAIASKGTETSSVASATYTIKTPITIAQAREQDENSTVFVEGIVTSCVGQKAYMQDETAAICAYGATGITVGDKVAVQGTLYNYNGLLEIKDPTCTVISQNNECNPVVVGINQIKENENQGLFVQIDNAKVTAISGQNTTIAQGDKTINVYGIVPPTDVDFTEGCVISITGNIGYHNNVQIENPTILNCIPAPAIKLSTNSVNVTAEGGDGSINVTYTTFVPNESECVFYEADGTTTATYDWIRAEINDEGNVQYTIEENTGISRKAYFKVYSLDEDANELYSELVTVTQAAVDYANLPFTFNEGKADVDNTNGLSHSGLGSDYNATTNPTTKLKFDTTGDYLVLKFNERPGTLSFDIKGNSFSGGTFKVQTSVDGKTYTDLEAYTSLGDTQSEEFDNLGEDVRYIKWIYTNKSSGNVGLGNIKLDKYETIGVSVTAAGYATYSNPEVNLDFSNVEGLTAYYVKSAPYEGNLVIEEAGKVPAGTAVLLAGAEGTYQVPACASAEEPTTNMLQVADDSTVGNGESIFVLANGNKGVGFYVVKDGSSIPAGKAYLVIEKPADGQTVKSFFSLGGDDANTINGVEAEVGTGIIYNLNGQRVAAPVKGGLYIVNGKKVMVK